MASVVVKAAEVIAKSSHGQRSAAVAAAKCVGDGGSGRSHAIDEEARHVGSDQPFVTLMSQLPHTTSLPETGLVTPQRVICSVMMPMSHVTCFLNARSLAKYSAALLKDP